MWLHLGQQNVALDAGTRSPKLWRGKRVNGWENKGWKRKQKDTKLIGTGTEAESTRECTRRLNMLAEIYLKLLAKRDGGPKKNAALGACPAKRKVLLAAYRPVICLPAERLPEAAQACCRRRPRVGLQGGNTTFYRFRVLFEQMRPPRVFFESSHQGTDPSGFSDESSHHAKKNDSLPSS